MGDLAITEAVNNVPVPAPVRTQTHLGKEIAKNRPHIVHIGPMPKRHPLIIHTISDPATEQAEDEEDRILRVHALRAGLALDSHLHVARPHTEPANDGSEPLTDVFPHTRPIVPVCDAHNQFGSLTKKDPVR